MADSRGVFGELLLIERESLPSAEDNWALAGVYFEGLDEQSGFRQVGVPNGVDKLFLASGTLVELDADGALDYRSNFLTVLVFMRCSIE